MLTNISVANSHYIMAQQKNILYSLITLSKKGNDIPEERRDLRYSAAKTRKYRNIQKI